MSDAPYLHVIGDQWDNIIALYEQSRDKDQIIEFEPASQKIYFYPAADYIQSLSERARNESARQCARAQKSNKFLLFVKDSENRRLWSYVFDLPE